jgi:soluble lytic murein transglycosylase-like protein
MKLRGRSHVFVFILLLTTVGSGQAQKKLARTIDPLNSKQMQQGNSNKETGEDFVQIGEDYKSSLKVLLALYENDVRKLTEHSEKCKELYAEGVISRREYETTTGEVAEAQVKVDEMRKQIATVEVMIARTGRLPPPVAVTPDSTSWTTGNSGIDALIRRNGEQYGVDPYFIFCVIQQESNFRSTALSTKGAQGLMQLMPGTAARYGVMNASDPAQNISGGTRYLKDLLQLFHGRIDLALAGYNAGEGAVIRHGQNIPPYKETENYVRVISKRYLRKRNFSKSTRNLTGA